MEEYAKALGDREHEQEQWVRPHLLMVSGDPTLLNLVRVLLDKAHYNVTTTNAVPLTFALIVAARPALLIVDLAITETSGWDLRHPGDHHRQRYTPPGTRRALPLPVRRAGPPRAPVRRGHLA